MPLVEPSDATATLLPFRMALTRRPAPPPACTCRHWVHCDCTCHGRDCDPVESSCDLDYLPDEGGLTRWGCTACTPGEGLPHQPACELIGWSIPLRPV